MPTLVSEIKCNNEGCGKAFDIYTESIQYANCTYEATCPHCNQSTRFPGQAGVKYLGDVSGFAEVREVEG